MSGEPTARRTSPDKPMPAGTTRVTEREPKGDNRASPADHLVPRYHNYLRRKVPHAVARSTVKAPVQRYRNSPSTCGDLDAANRRRGLTGSMTGAKATV